MYHIPRFRSARCDVPTTNREPVRTIYAQMAGISRYQIRHTAPQAPVSGCMGESPHLGWELDSSTGFS